MLKNYIKIAFKVMLRRKFFTVVSLFGISFTLSVLLVVTAFINNELGERAPETKKYRSLYVVWVETGKDDQESIRISTPSYHFISKYVKSLQTPESVTMFSSRRWTTEYVNDKNLDIDFVYTDAEFWGIFDFHFIAGKPYSQIDIDKSEPVVVINEDIAKQYFEGSEPLGGIIEINKRIFRVIGVVKDVPYKNWTVGPESKVWIPYTTIVQDYKKSELQPSFAPGFKAVLLAKKSADMKKIKAELQSQVDKVSFNNPKAISWLNCEALSQKEMLAYSAFFYTNDDQINKTNRPNSNVGKLYFWLGLVGLLFMSMPAINLMNLNSSRILERSSEIGIRKAFGASSNTLVGQFLTENIFVTLIGAAIGYGLAFVFINIINESGYIPYSNLKLNTTVFFYGLMISLFFGFLSGVYPAYRMSRLHPASALKQGGA